MKEKPGSDQGLSFRRLAILNGAKKKAPIAAAPKQPQKSGESARESDEARRSLYRQATQYLSGVISAVREDRQFSLEPGCAILERIAEFRSPMDPLFLKAIHSDDSYDFLVNHPVNVAIYAIKMAETLGYAHERIIEMGMVGLFHDIGMAKIPEEIIYKKDKLNDREFHLIKERPKLGYEILRQFGEDYAYLAECTLQIYERVDGSGYPRGLKEDEIHDYAQIIGLVDMYEALIHTRPQREKILHYHAVKEIIRSGKRQFQQKHLKTLLNTFSIFPIHSYVRMNSNAVGRVIQTHRDQLMRPKLQIVYDSQRKRVLTERIINLPEHSLLYITDAVSEEELLAISEESYLLTKPAGYDASEKYEDKTVKPERSEKTGVPVASKRFADIIEKRAPGSASRSKWQMIVLGLAVVLIAAGGIWQFMITENADTNTAPAVAEKTGAAAPAGESRQPETSTAPPASQEKFFPVPSNKTAVDTVITSGRTLQPPPAAVETTDTVAGAAEAKPVAETPSISAPETNKAAPVPQPVFENSVPPAAAYPFSILLSTVRTQAAAEDKIAAFRSSGIEAYWVRVDLGTQGIWHRVFSGNFKTLADARAFISKNGLNKAAAKPTTYANWIGSSEDSTVVNEKAREVSEAGFSPYVIQPEDGKYNLYVGAFYTKAGAEEQYRELEAKDIKNQIVAR